MFDELRVDFRINELGARCAAETETDAMTVNVSSLRF